MKDFQTQFEEATTTCIQCGEEFTAERFCCCDDGIFERNLEVRHLGGICTVCCKHGYQHSSQHERID